ncbi:MAG: flagellar protein FlaG [Alphaproteobacteria bacterium]|nr:flagellar protein FlaG [Alphaproteobacteria bacterium]
MTDTISQITPPASLPVQPVAPERRADLRQDAKDPGPVASNRAVEAVEKALKSMDPPIMSRNERLSIVRDDDTGTFIYRSIDRKTGEVIRQWPAESMLQFKAYLRNAEGVLVDRQV